MRARKITDEILALPLNTSGHIKLCRDMPLIWLIVGRTDNGDQGGKVIRRPEEHSNNAHTALYIFLFIDRESTTRQDKPILKTKTNGGCLYTGGVFDCPRKDVSGGMVPTMGRRAHLLHYEFGDVVTDCGVCRCVGPPRENHNDPCRYLAGYH